MFAVTSQETAIQRYVYLYACIYMYHSLSFDSQLVIEHIHLTISRFRSTLLRISVTLHSRVIPYFYAKLTESTSAFMTSLIRGFDALMTEHVDLGTMLT